nr:2OG-Fe(II) oxygenase [Allomuricauda sp.]
MKFTWNREFLQEELSQKGYVIVENVINDNECKQLISNFNDPQMYRKTVVMERYRFGAGTYKYFKYPLPNTIQRLREELYPELVPIANQWMHQLKLDVNYPNTLKELHQQCADHGQFLATPLILRYQNGGYNTLHQDLYGDVYFPMQSVLFLNDYGTDYTGGEFVLTEQVPRAQSKAMVLHPKKGSMLIFSTNFRPVNGKRGYYRVKMKHGVSEVHSGLRYTLGLIFHDAIQ